MYASLLTRKYLFGRIMPLLAAAAVALSTGLILVVWSVMGGFLSSLLANGSNFVGDVSITWPNAGFAYYDDLIKRLESDPKMVRAATPMIETYGMVTLPDERLEYVQVKGIDPQSYAKVVDYRGGIWWKPITSEHRMPRDRDGLDPRLQEQNQAMLEGVLQDALRLQERDPNTGQLVPACMPGIAVMGFSRRTPDGFYVAPGLGIPRSNGVIDSVKEPFAPANVITVTILPLDAKGRNFNVRQQVFPVANEYRTGVFQVDKVSLYVPLPTLQAMMLMNEKAGVEVDDKSYDPYGNPPPIPANATLPARVTTVLVKAVDGVTADALRDYCKEVYRAFAAAHPGKVPSYETITGTNRPLITTWAEQNATFVGAVQKETVMVLFLLSLIWIVCVLLILTIFWAMISEKTKDIGILRAIGVSSTGAAWVWLRYGLMLGLVGVIIGLLLGSLVVWNINPIHETLGKWTGTYVWDPRVYYFDEIPSKVDPRRAGIVAISGVFFSVVGALVPALRAALMRPVNALRFE